MDTKQLERIDYLLDSNEKMCNGLLFGDYGERNSDSFRGARESCRKNLTEIREILGIRELRKQQAIQEWLDTCKTILDNKEDVIKFFDFVNKEIDDIKFPKFHRDYKFNHETGKYDIENVKIDPPISAFFSELENETYSRQEWHDAIKDFSPVHGHKDNFFDEDIIAASYAFMKGPVGIQRKKAIAAESRTYDSLEELKESILTESKEKDMVLYMTFTFEKPDPRDVSLSTFTVTENYPKITMYCWRGVFLDKE